MFRNHCPALSPYYKIQFLLTNKVDTEDSMCNKVVLFNTNIKLTKETVGIYKRQTKNAFRIICQAGLLKEGGLNS